MTPPRSALTLALALTVPSGLPALAEPAPAATTLLEAVILTATRTPSAIFDTLSGSSLVTRAAPEHANAAVRDLIRAIPGASTQSNAADPGMAINLRGLQDFGRVNVMVDGARQNFQKFGHEANGTFYLDPEMLAGVDVTRGTASSLYGSGAIGGVVNFRTLTPDDLLAEGADRGSRIKLGYGRNGRGPTVNAVTAQRLGDSADILLGATVQRAGDYRDGTGLRHPSEQEMGSLLFKSRFRPADGHEIALSASRNRHDFTLLSRPSTAQTTSLSATYSYVSPSSPLWDFTAKTYSNTTTYRQTTPQGALHRDFDIQTQGIDLHNTARFDTDRGSHEVTIGADLFTDQVRNNADLTPDGDRRAWGLFVQDRFSYGGWLEVIGALRQDGYRLDGETIRVSGQRLSPKLTVGVTPHDWLTIFAGYSEGYRAPSLTETLVDGLHPPPAAGQFRPNPALRPEVAQSREIGVNLRFADLLAEGDQLGVKLTAFDTRVQDYIDQVRLISLLRPGYQFQNLHEARLRGVELDLRYDSAAYFASLSAQVLEGTNLATGKDLQKVPPARLSLTAGMRALEGRLTMGATATLVAASDSAASNGFIGNAHETLDLFATYQWDERLSADLSIQNLFDRDYTQFLNADPSPGRNIKAALTLRF